jgi:hypothetical protein
MATGRKAASEAGRELRTERDRKEKTVAASALAQSPRRKGRSARRRK